VTTPIAYLSGAIEHAPDGGTGWRLTLGRFLREELKHDVYDPAEEARRISPTRSLRVSGTGS